MSWDAGSWEEAGAVYGTIRVQGYFWPWQYGDLSRLPTYGEGHWEELLCELMQDGLGEIEGTLYDREDEAVLTLQGPELAEHPLTRAAWAALEQASQETPG